MAMEWDDSFKDRVRQAAFQAVVKGGEAVRSEAVRLIEDTEKSGIVYRRRGVEHQASAPGEPPASDTGHLVNSIESNPNADDISTTVAAKTVYAARMEFGFVGTDSIGRKYDQAPRPFLRPALANVKDQLVGLVVGSVRGVFKK